MKTLELLQDRRSRYQLERKIPLSHQELLDLIDEVTAQVPDAFNMQSQRLLVVTGENQDALWNRVFEVFEGKVPREKIDSFRAGYGTILYFYDQEVTEEMAGKFTTYADKFPHWAAQSLAMLQFSLWVALREAGIGASLQHYNPVIDHAVKQLFDLPETWVLDAQMPFGVASDEPHPKQLQDIRQRVIQR
ncbi:nitroreductase family protein [Varibaculum prostatecancerukia]|uniref:nitroreductase family protein n=1 Tax=Varibaculum prostatecancerukia TaxID=2811781 RepID=UPI001C007C9A|nr:nitroreductase family protein [Varibaculum prostatecancerukia]